MSKIAFYFGAHPDDWIFFHGEQAYSDLLNCDKDVLFFTTADDPAGEKEREESNKRQRSAIGVCGPEESAGIGAPVVNLRARSTGDCYFRYNPLIRCPS